MTPKNTRGKLIVIEGIDGSRKQTQAKLLVARLRKQGYPAQAVSFPLYEQSFFGALIGRYLAGELGDTVELNPYIASVLYAADRYEFKDKIESWLQQGIIVVADRYVSASQIHQGGKIKNIRKRKEFFHWLEQMEFSVFKIPKPDMILYFDVPIKFALQLLDNKKLARKKKYAGGKKDKHERDKKHLEDARRSAIYLLKNNRTWIRIQCVEKGKLLSIPEVAERVWKEVVKSLTLDTNHYERSEAIPPISDTTCLSQDCSISTQ